MPTSPHTRRYSLLENAISAEMRGYLVGWHIKQQQVSEKGQSEMTSDYIFIGKRGILATEALEPDTAAQKAQELARLYREPVTYAEVVAYDVQPDRCDVCGDTLPIDGVCPCSDFGD